MPSSSNDAARPDRARRRAVWIVPVVVAAGVAVAAAVTNGSAASASPTLPTRTVQQLLTAVQGSDSTALSGRVQEVANLGIPTLPGGHQSASLSWQTFVSGSHDARVWIDGADKQRVALIGELSEADVVHNGSDLWTYTSDTNTVTHTTLPAHTALPAHTRDQGSSAGKPDARELTPAAAAHKALAAISPTTKVSVVSTRMVADRAAYTVQLVPKDSNSTVSKVTVAIDAATSVPLQVQVFGSGSSPAFQTGFTSVSFQTPAASIFDFHAPAGARTSSNPFTAHGSGTHHSRGEHGAQSYSPLSASGTHAAAAPKVIGSGWTAVLEMPAGKRGSSPIAGNLPKELTTSVGSSGERLLHTALVNAVLLPDGRTFLGAVSPGYLEHLAATTPR